MNVPKGSYNYTALRATTLIYRLPSFFLFSSRLPNSKATTDSYFPFIMPTPSNSYLESPSFTFSKPANGAPESHSSPRSQSSWKSVFRLPNASSKKLPSAGPVPHFSESPPLPVSTSSSVSLTPVTPTTASLNPAYLSDQRSSYNSSNTQSTDSNAGLSSRGPYMIPPSLSYIPNSQHKSTDGLSLASPGKQRQQSKAERARPNITRLNSSPRVPPLTAGPSQSYFPPQPSTPLRTRTNGPLSPRSVSASASRFIRRVASAPNAKGLFSLGSKSSSSITKNGFLAPADTVPPLPQLVSSSSDQGQDSLETISSGSSRGRRNSRPMHSMGSNPLVTVAAANGLPMPPGKAPFRRTYSSNSIKVRQVRCEVLGIVLAGGLIRSILG